MTRPTALKRPLPPVSSCSIIVSSPWDKYWGFNLSSITDHYPLPDNGPRRTPSAMGSNGIMPFPPGPPGKPLHRPSTSPPGEILRYEAWGVFVHSSLVRPSSRNRQRLCHHAEVPHADQQPGLAVLHHLGHPAGVRRHHRHPVTKGIQYRALPRPSSLEVIANTSKISK